MKKKKILNGKVFSYSFFFFKKSRILIIFNNIHIKIYKNKKINVLFFFSVLLVFRIYMEFTRFVAKILPKVFITT